MLKLHFLNVADGDSILIQHETPDGSFCILVDAGRRYLDQHPGSLRRTAAQHLRARGISHLDALVVTHLHEDHFGGLVEIASQVSIDHAYTGFFPEPLSNVIPPDPHAPKTVQGLIQCLNQWRGITNELRAAGTEFHPVTESGEIPGPEGIRLKLVCADPNSAARQCRTWRAMGRGEDVPEEEKYWSSKWRNPGSLRLEVEYAGRRAILAGDCYGQVWQDSVQAPCDILKVPHHGDRMALTPSLVKKLHPAHGIISCAAGYIPRKDRPSLDAISMLRRVGCRVWFTDSFCAPCQQAAYWDSVDFAIGVDGSIYPPQR